MEPQQPLPPPPVPGQPAPFPYPSPGAGDPYHFIMEAPKTKPPRGDGIGQNPFLMKILFFLGGAAVLLVIAALVVNIFFNNKTNLQDLVEITQAEQEIIRISAQSPNASDQLVKNAAVTTQATLTSQQQHWVSFLAKRGRKVGTKEMALKKSAVTDQRLTGAKQTSTFDLTFTQIMRSQLQTYASSLKNAYTHATNKEEKTLLSKDFTDTQLLLEQWPEKPGE